MDPSLAAMGLVVAKSHGLRLEMVDAMQDALGLGGRFCLASQAARLRITRPAASTVISHVLANEATIGRTTRPGSNVAKAAVVGQAVAESGHGVAFHETSKEIMLA